MEKEGFITPKDHVHFLAKKLYGEGGKLKDVAVAYLEKGGGGPQTMHTHAHDHLFLVIRGQARIEMPGERVLLNADEAYLVAGERPHAVWNNLDSTTVMVGITLEKQG